MTIDGWCVRHGGGLPSPAPSCPQCAGNPNPANPGSAGNPGPANADNTGHGTGPAAPGVSYDPDVLGTAATNARTAAVGIESSTLAHTGLLATTVGPLLTVAALAECATACTVRATELATAVHGVSDNLSLTLADYARTDEDIAAFLNSILSA